MKVAGLERDIMRDTEIVDEMPSGLTFGGYRTESEALIIERQKKKLKEFFEAETCEFFKSVARVNKLRRELRMLTESSIPDKAKIDTKLDEIEATREILSKIQGHVMRMRKACSRHN